MRNRTGGMRTGQRGRWSDVARKSRKKQACEPPGQESPVFRAGLYCRLSQEREDTIERGTIGNQLQFLQDYAKGMPDLKISGVYVDDSVSGTTFQRPGFERMMSDIRAGRINCVVCKDASRLGRDYIETGNLIERVFPACGVRFISITDRFDTELPQGDLMMPVTNIANALYAKDISRKTASSKHTMMKKGIPTGAVPYGYKAVRNQDGIREMAVDEEAARIVRRVFAMFCDGRTQSEIVTRLNGENVLTPYQYRNREHPERLAGKEHLCWTLDIVSHILSNEVYTGRYVTGKDRVSLCNNEKRHQTDEAEWNVWENHHEAIVSKETFAQAGSQRKHQATKRRPEANLLRGKVVCGCCGNKVCDCPDKNRRYYLCTRKRRYGKASCASSPVAKNVMYDMVFRSLMETVRLVQNEEETARRYRQSDEWKTRMAADNMELQRLKRELDALTQRETGLYEDYRAGLLTVEEYCDIKEGYSGQRKQLESQMEAIGSAIRELEGGNGDGRDAVLRMLKSFGRRRKLSQDMVDKMVDRIVVHENKKIEVILSFEDEFRYLSGGGA